MRRALGWYLSRSSPLTYIRRLAIGLALALPYGLEAQAPQGVTAERLLQFGGLSDDPDRDLLQVVRVRRLAGGQFVVATGKPSSVRLFSPTGVELRSLGRSGGGPGEHRGQVDLGAPAGDTIAIVSRGNRRWSRFTTAGQLVQEFPVDSTHPLPGGLTMQHAAYTRHTLAGSRGCPNLAVLERYAPTEPFTFLEALTDGQGRTWRRDARDAAIWHVHTDDGVLRTTVRFPNQLTIHEFTGDLVVAVRTDDEDADHVEVYRVTLPPVRGPVPAPCRFPALRRDGVFRNLAIHTRNAMTAGQALAADFDRFPSEEQVLDPRLLVITAEAELKVLHVSAESWVFAVSHVATGAVCVGSIGPSGLPGWESGEVGCSPTGGTRRAR